jgi:ElaB/YqjD/DUF883 family membrane-anchored ribosome-binding protein
MLTDDSLDLLKSYVKNIINNELFWKDLLQSNQINTEIKLKINEALREKVDDKISKLDNKISKLNDKINDKINDKVNNKIRDNIPILVNDYVSLKVPTIISEHLMNKLPKLIVDQLIKEIPIFLKNDSIMNKILLDHSSSLNMELDKFARAYLEKIVHEEEYHLINKAFFNALDDKFNSMLKEKSKLIDDENIKLKAILNDTINNIVNHKNEVKNSILKLNEMCNELNNNYNSIRNNWIFTTFAMLAAIGILHFSKMKYC